MSSSKREMSKRLCFRIQTFSFGFCGVLSLIRLYLTVTKEVGERERERAPCQNELSFGFAREKLIMDH